MEYTPLALVCSLLLGIWSRQKLLEEREMLRWVQYFFSGTLISSACSFSFWLTYFCLESIWMSLAVMVGVGWFYLCLVGHGLALAAESEKKFWNRDADEE